MATNLGIDDEVLTEALELGGLKTKKATVNAALLEFVQRRKRLKLVEMFGTVEFDPDYDYKAGRNRQRGRSGG